MLIQEIFGVNQAMRDIAAWVADLGFIAVCPDLFWRIEPGIDITDKSEAEWKQAFELFRKFDQVTGIDDLKATVAAARELPGAHGKVGTMGYCLGGRLASVMAEQSDADTDVSYYGVGLDRLLGDLDKITRPLIVHIADQGTNIFPAEGRAKVVERSRAHRLIGCYVYPNADHAFARVGGMHWDGRCAAIANGRSAEALVKALGLAAAGRGVGTRLPYGRGGAVITKASDVGAEATDGRNKQARDQGKGLARSAGALAA